MSKQRTMLPRAHLPDQDLVLSVILNKDLTTSTVHPLFLPPVVCWLNSACKQSRRWKLKVYTFLRLLSTAIVLVTIAAHALHLYNWDSLNSTAVTWSLSVCSALLWGMHIGATSSLKKAERDKSTCRVYPDYGVSKPASLALCLQLMLAYVCTWLYSQNCRGRTDMYNNAMWSHLYEWTLFVFVWINTVGFLRLFRRI